MQVTITINHNGRCERLIWEKRPMQDEYKFIIECDGKITYNERHLFSREFVADTIKSARRVVGKEYVEIKK